MARSLPARDIAVLLGGVLTIAAVAFVLRTLPEVSPTTVALVLLLIVLATATFGRLWIATVTAVTATLTFNFFFLPPLGTLTIADAQNWIALFAFLVVAVIASNLSAAVQARAREAIARRNEVTRLFDLTRDVLLTTETTGAIEALARHVARRFELSRVAICLPGDRRLACLPGCERGPRDRQSGIGHGARQSARRRGIRCATACVWRACARRTESGHLDRAVATWHEGHRVARGLIIDDRYRRARRAGRSCRDRDRTGTVSRGTRCGGARSAERPIWRPRCSRRSATTCGRRSRQSESPSRTCARSSRRDERREQSRAAISELSRLTRLVQDILDMARIDAAAIRVDRNWVTAEEVVDAAIAYVRPTIEGRPLRVNATGDLEVEIDPRLASGALSHILENAAQYSPVGPRNRGERARRPRRPAHLGHRPGTRSGCR